MTEVLSVEVLAAPRPTERVRARNAIRAERSSMELLPPDVDSKVDLLRTLDGESQARAVTALLCHSRTGLLAAIAAQDLPQIVEYKAKAAAINEIAKQLRLGKEMQFDAAEFLRRAERGVACAIRTGQANGEVLTDVEEKRRNCLKGVQAREDKAGRSGSYKVSDPRPAPADLITSGERNGQYHNGTRFGSVFDLSDGISDAQFEEALTEAKAEGNLSRANVARKAKVKTAKAPTANVPKRPRDDKPASPPLAPLTGRKPQGPKANSAEMLANIDGMLAAIVQTCQYINPADIDPAKRAGLVRTIRDHLGAVRRMMREIENA